MINEHELQISNKSYTNKDFQTIYPEALELVKKLTNKWDPSQSNESDPGVILLKLAAFIADKNNYNIDKNILETFMPSATQETSMRNLCEMNGYDMKYYRAAECIISFMFTGEEELNYNQPQLKALNTAITDVDNTIVYTLIKDVQLSKDIVSDDTQVNALQGTAHDLIVNDNSVIQLVNLDDNNRIYIPDIYAAENGIFFVNEQGNILNDWVRVSNLNLVTPGNTVYKFGFDSIQNLPYIEFPTDIAALIGEGLRIKYISTDGSKGNVKAKFLSQFLNTTNIKNISHSGEAIEEETITLTSENIIITNTSASYGGADPETINEAYNSFKKTVGTFDTLVTCKDYANAIYNSHLVSNVQVSDRRTDINYSNNIVTYGSNGVYKCSNSKDITPYDLVLYPLKKVNSVYDPTTYNETFKPARNLDDLSFELEDYKTISHNYKALKDKDIYAFKNYYSLDIKIATNNKVNASEQLEIRKNVLNALIKAYNARNLDYGYEIPYDSILETIQNADSRIKIVSLAEPEINTWVMSYNPTSIDNSNEEKLEETSDYYYSLAAKNVLEGKISLFDYDKSFNWEFGQIIPTQEDGALEYPNDISVYKNLKSITTEVNIPSSELKNSYILKENEVIQMIAPNLGTAITYPAYVHFRLENIESIIANEDRELKDDEKVHIRAKDSNGSIYYKTYDAGDILRFNFDFSSDENRNTEKKEDIDYYYLNTSEKIEERYIVNVVKNDAAFNCYWITKDNVLFNSSLYERILEEGEYFIYTNSAKTEINILGSGTKLSLLRAPEIDWKITDNTIDIDDINNNGLAAFSSTNWQAKNLSNNNLSIQEMKIINLSSSDSLKISDESDIDFEDPKVLGNNWIAVTNPDGLTYNNNQKIPGLNISNNSWRIRSRLDLNSTLTKAQKIGQYQKLILTTIEENAGGNVTTPNYIITANNNDNLYLNFDRNVQLAGGVDVDLSITYLTSEKSSYDMSAFLYLQKPLMIDGTNKINLERNETTGFIDIDCSSKISLALPVITNINDSYRYLMMIYWEKSQADDTAILSAKSEGNVKLFNSDLAFEKELSLNQGLNVIEIETGTKKVTLEATPAANSNSKIKIGKLHIIKGINPVICKNDANNTVLTNILSKIKEKATDSDGKDLFYYISEVNNSSVIDVDNLASPEAFWDSNNIANKFTIAQIDFRDKINNKDNPAVSKIEIVKSSRL